MTQMIFIRRQTSSACVRASRSRMKTASRLIAEALANDQSIVLACSALKEEYRAQFKPHGANHDVVRFIYLRVPPAVAAARLKDRPGHFMPAALVPSQFAALEEPADATVIDAMQPPDEIVAQICRAL
jgi:gluconokinase